MELCLQKKTKAKSAEITIHTTYGNDSFVLPSAEHPCELWNGRG